MRAATLGRTPAPQGDQPSDPAAATVRRICSRTSPCLHPQLSLSITNKCVGFICPSGSRVQPCFPLRWTTLPNTWGLMLLEMHWGIRNICARLADMAQDQVHACFQGGSKRGICWACPSSYEASLLAHTSISVSVTAFINLCLLLCQQKRPQ